MRHPRQGTQRKEGGFEQRSRSLDGSAVRDEALRGEENVIRDWKNTRVTLQKVRLITSVQIPQLGRVGQKTRGKHEKR